MPPKRYNYIDRILNILDRSGTTDILKSDQHLLFLFKKTERLVAALYLVTSLLSDTEALKWELRKSGTSLSTHILSFMGRVAIRNRESYRDALREIAHLFSLLDIAHAADLLSPMNASLIKDELQMIVSVIDERQHYSGLPSGSPTELKESFFWVPRGIFTGAKRTVDETAVSSSQHIEAKRGGGTAAFRTFEELKYSERSQKDIYKGHTPQHPDVLYKRTNIQQVGDAQLSPSQKSSSRPLLRKVKDERKQNIINILRQRDSATVRDFSVSIGDCSEKTIQRLLIEMVQDSVLKREGARRWSRYSMSDRQAIVR